MARKRRSVTPEYKAEVVGLISDGGKAISAIARDLGLTESALRRWVERSAVDSGFGAPQVLTTVERDELATAATGKLSAANGARNIKKATAFFAKESM